LKERRRKKKKMEETKQLIANFDEMIDKMIDLRDLAVKEGRVLRASLLEDALREADGAWKENRIEFGLDHVRRCVQKKEPCEYTGYLHSYPNLMPNMMIGVFVCRKIVQCEMFVRKCLQEAGEDDPMLVKLLSDVLEAKMEVVNVYERCVRFKGLPMYREDSDFAIEFLSTNGRDISDVVAGHAEKQKNGEGPPVPLPWHWDESKQTEIKRMMENLGV
jgi:hypothetical protein